MSDLDWTKIDRSIGFRALLEREVFRFFTVFTQTILPPIISSFLFIFIFGFFLGRDIQVIQGIPYLQFLIPGLVMMYLIENAYANTSSSLFIARWSGHIQELLVSPLSYAEMVLAMILGGLVRSFTVAFGVFIVSLFFVQFSMPHIWIVLYFSLFVSLSFSCLGLIAGLLAEEWEHLSLLTTFILTPLIYFGGVFHSAQTIPNIFQIMMHLNPIFYMVNGMRYGMLGSADVKVTTAMSVVFGCFVVLFVVTVYMFKTGYKLRK